MAKKKPPLGVRLRCCVLARVKSYGNFIEGSAPWFIQLKKIVAVNCHQFNSYYGDTNIYSGNTILSNLDFIQAILTTRKKVFRRDYFLFCSLKKLFFRKRY